MLFRIVFVLVAVMLSVPASAQEAGAAEAGGAWWGVGFWILITLVLVGGAILLAFKSAKRPNKN